MAIDEIIGNFELLDEWEDRYRYLIELGRTLEPLPKDAYNDANKVRGCASQVWLETTVAQDAQDRLILTFHGDSDAHIVRGLVALTLALYSGHTAQDIIATDAVPVFAELGLAQHLTPQRSNGLRAMVERIKAEARAAFSLQAPCDAYTSTSAASRLGRQSSEPPIPAPLKKRAGHALRLLSHSDALSEKS
jgi:cysteine desulfuration protein SufE